jgi:hypothetical protein
MTYYQIIINGRVFSKFKAASSADAIKTARKEASDFARSAWRYKDAYPNSVLVECLETRDLFKVPQVEV